MTDRRRIARKAALRAAQGRPSPSRWRYHPPGGNKSYDAALKRLRQQVLAALASDGAELFKTLLTRPQRTGVDFSFDWSIANGDRNPASVVVIATRLARNFLHECPDAEEALDVYVLLHLIEDYPALAIAYAAARIATYEQRHAGAP